jgi:hypothetical protein
MKLAIIGNNKVDGAKVCYDLIEVVDFESGSAVARGIYGNTPLFDNLDFLIADDLPIAVGHIEINGNWYPWHSVENLGWVWVREKRDIELARTDWTQVSDNSLTPEKRLEWANYRQTLRDITTAFAEAVEVVFPDRPE